MSTTENNAEDDDNSDDGLLLEAVIFVVGGGVVGVFGIVFVVILVQDTLLDCRWRITKVETLRVTDLSRLANNELIEGMPFSV